AQLEKMYKADELTEETEEIVLRRARNAVERATFLLERAEVFYKRTTAVDLPRQEVSVRESADRVILESSLLLQTLPARLEQTKLEAERAKIARERSEERLADLEVDRKLMTITAPAEGIVYYGRCVDGKWRRGSSAESLANKGMIPANDVFMTIVDPRPLVVRTSVPEKHLADVRPGLQGTATPAGYPELKLPVRLAQIARVPDASTEFNATFKVSLGLEAEPLMPGMTCKMEFTPYRQRRAVVVPPKTVFADEWDAKKQYVWLYREGAKPRRQVVTLGRKTDEKVEILDGVEAGDEILLKAPEDAAKK
ncbi:MAG: HlyD family efflux transporter periplasmic adaptor subunit, partial [Patescibacteria group bacterium]|nr:HlyD family efflux transporter periplasmic adaptor subunit [Patescibacteria group bacterium]